jgi:site-specific recombinase XerD
MSPLRQAVDDYLELRRSLGFKLREAGYFLPSFVEFLEQKGAKTITMELAVRWAQLPASQHPAWWAKRLSAVRQFAKYFQTLDPRTEIPPANLLPAVKRRVTPYLYSDSDAVELMRAARTLPTPQQRATYPALIGLLFVTGMRVGEAIGLDRTDLDWDSRLLTIRSSKFGKSREVAFHDSTLEALAQYARSRDQLHPRSKSPSFFVSSAGTRLHYANVQRTFRRLVQRAGLKRLSERQPRLHDLRHSFAVRTMINWYSDGQDVEARLPLLSTYLGHFDPNSTYWYLSAAPELLALAAERLEMNAGGRP